MSAGPASKVTTEAALAATLAEHRAHGRRVAMTNGAFDLLHVGHVRLLRAAAALGDVLVVAVNDDASVRAAKGAGRPVVPAAERAEVVAAVEGVAHVVVFPDATVDRLLRVLRPHWHVKGTDYDDATLPEAATDRDLGVRTVFLGDEKAHASREIAARVRGGGSVPREGTSSDGAPIDDRVVEVSCGRGRGRVLAARAATLREGGLLDLDALVSCREGEEVHRHATRTVRRFEAGGETVFLKVARPKKSGWREKGTGAFAEQRNHLALRAAGFRAPEPWLAVEGKASDGARATALLTRRLPGDPLDAFLRQRSGPAGGRERGAWARGVGAALRALHTARFLHPDLLAYHLHVEGSPADGARSVGFLDLARLSRASSRVGPKQAAPGLAALALSLRPVTTRRWRLAVLRAYLGGSLRGAKPWLDAIARRIRRVEGRGTFRPFADRHLEDVAS
jgi:rfaE bifunctional protein nucleotidyltransferase chain/domain